MPKAAEVEQDVVKRSAKDANGAIDDQAETMKSAMALQERWAKFYARRVQKDVETLAALSRCRTPADVVDVWADAARAAARDYQDGATLMMEASMTRPADLLRTKS
jgi:hypothetical protein